MMSEILFWTAFGLAVAVAARRRMRGWKIGRHTP